LGTQSEKTENEILSRLSRIEEMATKFGETSGHVIPFPKSQMVLDFLAKYIAIFGLLFATGAGVLGGVNLWENTNNMIERAETRMARLTDNLEPTSATVLAADGTPDGMLYASVSVFPQKIDDLLTLYNVQISTKLFARIVGENGTLLGSNWKWSDNFVKLVSKDIYGKDASKYREVALREGGSFESREISVTSNSIAGFDNSVNIAFESCDVALEIMQKIIDLQPPARLSVQPIFKSIRDAPDYSTFDLLFEKNLSYRCPTDAENDLSSNSEKEIQDNINTGISTDGAVIR
jgi:hypothetical protein